MTTHEQLLLEKIKRLPPETLAEVEQFLDSLAVRYRERLPIEDSDDWTDVDLREAAVASWHYVQSLEEEK
ncbi:MAG: hypothetical protein HY774_04245 [Acidobacteria bacterium]|nr:hypothetical protein [Acidobacteriota bacterium]